MAYSITKISTKAGEPGPVGIEKGISDLPEASLRTPSIPPTLPSYRIAPSMLNFNQPIGEGFQGTEEYGIYLFGVQTSTRIRLAMSSSREIEEFGCFALNHHATMHFTRKIT
ncbi:hypothetical protein V6N12_042334 [Hibiscus sabdariffa]|uniref:Uncharacterized protein n=1 Tax=Hibiscus sabdariffa TaxID=183260 RepID=A0ABR2EGR2_9ROSI